MKSYRVEIERLIPLLRQYARALVSDQRADVADDLVHDALAHALRSERNWAGEDIAVKLFGRLVAVNRSRTRHEVGERRSLPGSSGSAERKTVEPMMIPGVARTGPSGPASQPLKGLDALSPGDREALLLVVLGGFDYARTAQILGVPAGTLVVRLTHARETLGQTLWGPALQPDDVRSGEHRPRRATHLRVVK